MNKAELVAAMAEKAELSKKDAEAASTGGSWHNLSHAQGSGGAAG